MIKEYIIKIDEDQSKKDINGGYPLIESPVELVRCGDCENFCFDNISPNAGRCMLTTKSHSKTWFCAHGKREDK